MSTTGDDYDSLSKEEREARDKADREREEAEQAGLFTQQLSWRRTHIPKHCRTLGSSS